jgi:ribonuclease HI
VDVGEALGLHSALQWLSDMQFDNVDFETDSKLTSDAFLATRTDLSEFGCNISSCRSLFSTSFSNSRVKFVRRQANAVAHALAREATSLASPAVYFDIPNCIETLIINEML